MALDARILKAMAKNDVTSVTRLHQYATESDPKSRKAAGYLHLAAVNNSSARVAAILWEFGCDIWARDSKDRLPLHYAAMYNNSNSAELAKFFIGGMRYTGANQKAYRDALDTALKLADREKNERVSAVVSGAIAALELKKAARRGSAVKAAGVDAFKMTAIRHPRQRGQLDFFKTLKGAQRPVHATTQRRKTRAK